jgi:hypothetical protein
MSDAYGSSPLPPAPPSSFRAGGCLKWGLIGCGGLIVLFILAGIGMTLWVRSHSDEFQASGSVAVRQGARFGLQADEAGCLAEGTRRANEASGFSGAFSVGGFMRSCLEFSRPTAGFCENVPPPTAIRRSIAWQQERCKGDRGCASVIGVVQNYCSEGRRKRIAADTLTLPPDSSAAGARAPADTTVDSMRVGAEEDSSSF